VHLTDRNLANLSSGAAEQALARGPGGFACTIAEGPCLVATPDRIALREAPHFAGLDFDEHLVAI